MVVDPALPLEQPALLAKPNSNCPICYGENINALISTDERTDRPMPANHEPIPILDRWGVTFAPAFPAEMVSCKLVANKRENRFPTPNESERKPWQNYP